MIKLLIFSLSIFVLSHFNGHSQIISVLDNDTRQPISNVNISEITANKILSTDYQGRVDITTLSNLDSLVLSHPGYHPIIMAVRDFTNTNYKVVLSEKTYSLDEVVVSGNKFEQNQNSFSQQVQIAGEKTIKFQNQQTTADMLLHTGNVYVQKSQMGGGSPILRGFEANKVLLVVDGIRMNNAIYRAGHLQNVITLDNNTLEKTEVVFGPGSLMYGSDALGGVIHFYTKSPIFNQSNKSIYLTASALTRYSTANQEKTAHVDFNIGLKRLASFTSISFSDYSDLRTGRNRNAQYGDWGKSLQYVTRINGKDSVFKNNDVDIQRNTQYNQVDLLQKVLFKSGQNLSHTLNLQYSTSSDISRYDRLSETSKGLPRSSQWYYGPQNRGFASYTLHLTNKLLFSNEAKVIAAYQRIEESRHNRNFNSYTLNHRKENVQVYTLNLDLLKTFNSSRLQYGVEGTHNFVNSTALRENVVTGVTTPLDTRYPSGGSTLSTIALYADQTIKLTPALEANAGVRYSLNKLKALFTDKTFFPFPYNEVKLNNSAITGSVGLVFRPVPRWKFSVIGSTAYRSPNVDDLGKFFEQSGGGRVMVPNPELKPEHTYNIDLGISKSFDDKTWLQVNAFYTLYKDAISPMSGSFNGQDSITYNGVRSKVIILSNVSRGSIYGLSSSVTSQLTKHLSFYGTFNYTYGRLNTDTTKYPLDHIPPVFGKAALTYKFARAKVETFVLYNGWKRLKNYNLVGEDNVAYASSQGSPGWFTFNVRGSYNFLSYLEGHLAIENIFDTHYRTFASGISAPGRNFIISLRVKI